MALIAIPNRDFPPDDQILELADWVLDSLRELTPDVVHELG
jgi:hypothetical protein